MNISLEDIPFSATKWEVTDAIGKVLHGPLFYSPDDHKARPINFEVRLEKACNGLPNNGKGTVIIPDKTIGEKFFKWAIYRENGIRVHDRRLYMTISQEAPRYGLVHILQNTMYVDPMERAEREQRLDRISQYPRILLDAIQFGVYFRRLGDPHTMNRQFSIEYEIVQEDTFAGELLLDYDHRLFKIEMGDCVCEDMVIHIVIDLLNIKKSAYGVTPGGQYYVCLELSAPPRFERQARWRSLSGDRDKDKKHFRERLPHLGGIHEDITQHAYQLRLVLTDKKSRQHIKGLFEEAGIAPPAKAVIEVATRGFFLPARMKAVQAWVASFDWPIRFQIDALLRNGLAHTGDLYDIRDLVEGLARDRPTLAADFLRRLSEKLRSRSSRDSVRACFENALADEKKDADKFADEVEEPETQRSTGMVQSPHIIITPTRILLDGPYDTQSNRIIRKYFEFRENFVRVEFREENKMAFRWPKEVSARSFIEERFGNILKKGFEIADKHFDFLGYSMSGLGEHTTWFMSEFDHPDEGRVTVNKIRDDLGDFSECIKIPSKYAARIAQAFSGTDPSIRIKREQWDVIEDMGTPPHEHTDGQGTMSVALRDRIWDVLTRARPDRARLVLKPSAYQIRFLGFKGVVVVDERLEGECMRLRPSMRKYEAKDVAEAEIEIAKAFIYPGPARLCRPLVAVLEDRGVRKEAFLELQNEAKQEVVQASDTMASTANLFQKHDLGNVFGLRWIIHHLENAGVGMGSREPQRKDYMMDNEFVKRLIKYARTHILREIKHDARINIKNAHQLVGVVDEGPAWLAAGVEDVFCLKEGEIFACVQQPDRNEPVWIKGLVSISRSPHIHPGDVQRVRAIGKPPPNVPCFFRNLRNVVVMPSVGTRSLASCLAGGDVDGDEFLVIKDPRLLPTTDAEPADYAAPKPEPLDRESTVDDICDFFVEYMQSDVTGLLADQHLIIADQSKDGVFDRDCLTLAGYCSQAVDYPKNGVPVNIENIPQTRIRAKPDWKKSEDNVARPGDFYESPRALGALFRNIDIRDVGAPSSSYPNGAPITPVREMPLCDSISRALRPAIEYHLGHFANSDADIEDVEPLFGHYARELGYICLTHAPAENTDVRLSEEEVVVGAILAKCSQRRWKKDRMHRMREHASQLVREIKHRRKGFGVPLKRDNHEEVAEEELLAPLAKAWAAWDFGMRNRHTFGANSFGMIGLAVVCEMLDKLEKLEAAAATAKAKAED